VSPANDGYFIQADADRIELLIREFALDDYNQVPREEWVEALALHIAWGLHRK
jgi:hypothetical protein